MQRHGDSNCCFLIQEVPQKSLKTWYNRGVPSQPVSQQQCTPVFAMEFSFFKSTVVQLKRETWNQYVSLYLVQSSPFRGKRWNVEVHYQKVLFCSGTYLFCHTEPIFHFLLKLLQIRSKRYIKSHFGNVELNEFIIYFGRVFWVCKWRSQ